jgi:hypothetical protein
MSTKPAFQKVLKGIVYMKEDKKIANMSSQENKNQKGNL